MRCHFIVLSLFLLVSVSAKAEDKPDVSQQMESFRKEIPLPQTLSEQNGFGLTDNKGKHFLLTHLSGVADRMHIVGRVDMIILMSYLKDADPKIRFIAANALEKPLQVFPGGMSLGDITDIESDGHVKMVLAFAKKIAEQSSAGDVANALPVRRCVGNERIK